MMLLCKTINTLLGYIEDSKSNREKNNPSRKRNIPLAESGGLRCVIGTPLAPTARGDPGGWGLHEAAGPTCTESLGSESCVDDASESITTVGCGRIRSNGGWKWKSDDKTREKSGKGKKLPPPLPWLTESNGGKGCCCYMKRERKDGRFLLKEVRIERPEVMRASRRDGRLRLHLVEDEKEDLTVSDEAAVAPIRRNSSTMRCQDDANVNGNMQQQMWWNHGGCFVTTV